MTNVLKILNPSTFAVIGTIENVLNPLVVEEINQIYTFQFDTIYDATTKNILGNIFEVDGDYFQALRINRSLDRGYTIGCEHVSYGLNQAYNSELTEFEDTAHGMIEAMLVPLVNWFTIGTIADTEVKYYKAGANDSVRKRIIDVANLFGLEIIWNKYTISLVNKRGNNLGSSTNVEFAVGLNLINIQEEYDLTIVDENEGYPIPSYDVEIVDLAHLEGYEELVGAQLGDDVHVKADVLDLDFYSRIVQREYNPFQKANVRVQIGRVKRDITDYLKEEPEEEEEEIDPTANYYLSKFNIGSQDCLKVMGVEIDNDLALPEGISANLEYSSNNQYTGVFIELKSQYSSYFITVYKVLKDGKFETFDYSTQSASINTWLLPTEDIVGIGVIVTKTPFTTFDATKDDFRQYGVNFTKLILDPFREFKIGTVNCLTLTDLSLDNTATLPADIKAEIQYEQLNGFTGLFLSLKKEFSSWHIQIQTFNKAGAATTHNFADIKDTVKTWTLPNDNVMAIVVTIMEKPPEVFVEGTHLKQVYGVKFTQIEVPPDYWLSELKFGEIDCLVDGLDVTELTLNNPPFGDVPPPAPLPGGAELSVESTINNITLKIKDEYADYQKYLYFFNANGDSFSPSFEEGVNENNTGMGVFPLVGEWYLKIFIIQDIDNYRMYQVKVNVTPETVDGLITIKHKDEIGNVISIREQVVTAAGIYEITADEIDGYEFVPIIVDPNTSPYIRKVEITKESPNATVEFTYRPTSTQPKKGYVMEFGIAQLAPLVNFEFENEEGYDEVKSVVHGLMGTLGNNDADIKVTAIQTNGKYTGIQVTSNVASSSTSINIQAVCFNEVG